MKLQSLCLESIGSVWFKGFTIWSGLNHIKDHGKIIPGFLGPFALAWIYAEPKLTGKPDDPSAIIKVSVNYKIEDLTEEFFARGYKDVSVNFPVEWRENRVWTVKKRFGAHGPNEFIFCGKEVDYITIRRYKNEQEWQSDYSE